MRAGSPPAGNGGGMAKSAVSSIIDKYNGITASLFGATDRPPIFLGKVAQTTGAGAAQRVPYVCLMDDGFNPTLDSSYGGIEAGEIKLEVYALKVDDATGVTVDSICRAIKFAGGTPAQHQGFDGGSLSFASGSFLYSISLLRTRERRDYAGFDYQGARVHLAELTYAVTVGLSSS